jgi:hypothetical protein
MRWIVPLLTSAGFEIFSEGGPNFNKYKCVSVNAKCIALAYVYQHIFFNNNLKRRSSGKFESLPQPRSILTQKSLNLSVTQSLYVKSVINNLQSSSLVTRNEVPLHCYSFI